MALLDFGTYEELMNLHIVHSFSQTLGKSGGASARKKIKETETAVPAAEDGPSTAALLPTSDDMRYRLYDISPAFIRYLFSE